MTFSERLAQPVSQTFEKGVPGTSEQRETQSSRIKYIGFDMDGTLLDTMLELRRTFVNHLYERFGIPEGLSHKHFDKEPVIPDRLESLFMDPRVKEIIGGRRISPKVMDETGRIIRARWLKSDAPPYPEVLGVLDTLKRQGYIMFVSSNAREEEIERKLKFAQIYDYFVAFLGRDSHGDPRTWCYKGEPHFRLAAQRIGVLYEEFIKTALFVEDLPTDVKTVVDTNVPVIGRKSFTTKNNDELWEAGVVNVLRDLTELQGTIRVLEGRRLLPTPLSYSQTLGRSG